MSEALAVEAPKRWLPWVGRAISALPAALILFSASLKITSSPMMVDGLGKAGFSPGLVTAIGVLELTCLALSQRCDRDIQSGASLSARESRGTRPGMPVPRIQSAARTHDRVCPGHAQPTRPVPMSEQDTGLYGRLLSIASATVRGRDPLAGRRARTGGSTSVGGPPSEAG